MFKCHLDVGFTDTQAAIMRKYFDDYFPRAMQVADGHAPVGRGPVCLDHGVVASVRISGTSFE